MTLVGKQAALLDAFPVVQNSTDRDTKYPSPDTNFRVHNLTTGYVEQYDGANWNPVISTEKGGNQFNVKAYGAKGDGVTDDSAAIQAAINAAYAANGVVYLPATPNGYNIGATTLLMNGTSGGSFSAVSMVGGGDAYRAVQLLYTGTGLKYVGGSGQNCGARVRGIAFKGSSTTVAIEVQGQNEVQFHGCRFQDNKTGILCHNATTGMFTEYIQAHDCAFETACLTAIEYKVTSGTDSFNGSGLVNCLINTTPATAPAIQIDAGAKVYGAPLSAQIWTQGTSGGSIIQNNEPTQWQSFFGHLRIENQSSAGTIYAADPAKNKVRFLGGLLLTGYERVQLGKLYLASLLGVNASNVVAGFDTPRQYTKAMTTGANTLTDCTDLPGTFLATITLVGTNYIYQHVGILAADTFGNYAWVQLANPFSTNTAGYGAATIGVSAGNLTVTNASFPASGVTASYTLTPLAGDTRNAPILQNAY